MDPRRDEAVLIAPNGGGPNPPCHPKPESPPPPGPSHEERGASLVHLAWPLGRPARPKSVLARVHHLPAMRLPPARIMGEPTDQWVSVREARLCFRLRKDFHHGDHGEPRRGTEKAGQSPEGQSRPRARTDVVEGRIFGRGCTRMAADKRERAHGRCHRSGTSAAKMSFPQPRRSSPPNPGAMVQAIGLTEKESIVARALFA